MTKDTPLLGTATTSSDGRIVVDFSVHAVGNTNVTSAMKVTITVATVAAFVAIALRIYWMICAS